MHHSLNVDADVRVFEASDRLPAALALRKHCEHVSRELLEHGVVVPAGQRRHVYSSLAGA
jgi:hypothetical protein